MNFLHLWTSNQIKILKNFTDMTLVKVAAHVGLGHPLEDDLVDGDLGGCSSSLDFAVRFVVAVVVVVDVDVLAK
jgi:hypothetical protein